MPARTIVGLVALIVVISTAGVALALTRAPAANEVTTTSIPPTAPPGELAAPPPTAAVVATSVPVPPATSVAPTITAPPATIPEGDGAATGPGGLARTTAAGVALPPLASTPAPVSDMPVFIPPGSGVTIHPSAGPIGARGLPYEDDYALQCVCDPQTGRPEQFQPPFTGSVADEVGAPLEGMCVTVNRSFLTHSSIGTYTRADGTFELQLGTYGMGISAMDAYFDDCGRGERSPVSLFRPQGPVQVTLSRRGSFVGTAYDTTGAPVANGCVRGWGQEGSFSVPTDSAGRFRVDGLVPAMYNVALESPCGTGLYTPEIFFKVTVVGGEVTYRDLVGQRPQQPAPTPLAP